MRAVISCCTQNTFSLFIFTNQWTIFMEMFDIYSVRHSNDANKLRCCKITKTFNNKAGGTLYLQGLWATTNSSPSICTFFCKIYNCWKQPTMNLCNLCACVRACVRACVCFVCLRACVCVCVWGGLFMCVCLLSWRWTEWDWVAWFLQVATTLNYRKEQECAAMRHTPESFVRHTPETVVTHTWNCCDTTPEAAVRHISEAETHTWICCETNMKLLWDTSEAVVRHASEAVWDTWSCEAHLKLLWDILLEAVWDTRLKLLWDTPEDVRHNWSCCETHFLKLFETRAWSYCETPEAVVRHTSEAVWDTPEAVVRHTSKAIWDTYLKVLWDKHEAVVRHFWSCLRHAPEAIVRHTWSCCETHFWSCLRNTPESVVRHNSEAVCDTRLKLLWDTWSCCETLLKLFKTRVWSYCETHLKLWDTLLKLFEKHTWICCETQFWSCLRHAPEAIVRHTWSCCETQFWSCLRHAPEAIVRHTWSCYETHFWSC